MTSIVVPAHNEARVLDRLLSRLKADSAPGELDIVVVANGCTDGTAAVAAGFDGVRVIETPVASKSEALRLGDAAARGFPRVYVDADVVLGAGDVRALCHALRRPGVLAAGPVRSVPMNGVGVAVRWYYDVWQRLPQVRAELFGRGVIALSDEGHARLGDWGEVMSDDLAVATAFRPDERVVVPNAVVEIKPPKTYADLLRRRTRAMTGNAQLAATAPAGRREAPRTSVSSIVRLVVDHPLTAPKALVFLATAGLARARARRADPSHWLRDESSRA